MGSVTGSVTSNYETYPLFETQRTLYYTVTPNEAKKSFTISGSLTCMVKSKNTSSMTVPFTENYIEIKNSKNQEILYREDLPFSVYVEAGQTSNNEVVTFSTTILYDANGTKRIKLFDNYVGDATIYVPELHSCSFKVNNEWKRARPLIKINNTWKPCTLWKKISGIWKIGF